MEFKAGIKFIPILLMCHSRVRPVGQVYLEVHAKQYQLALAYFPDFHNSIKVWGNLE
jgi:hypothetical protein